jgi:ankyrin repeat protein
MNVPREDFFTAIDAGDVARVDALLAADSAAVALRDSGGVSAVRHALYRGQREVASRLAAVAPALDVFDLAALGDANALADLVRLDPLAVNAFSEDGFTALHFAAFLGGVDAAQALIDAGADVAAVAQNAMQVQPINSAAAGCTEVVAVLLDAGAPVDAQQHGGYTALHEAAINGNDALVDVLLARGADVALTDSERKTAADHAERNGHRELAARLR